MSFVELDKQNHSLVRSLVNLLPHCQIVLQGLRPGKPVQNIINLSRAEPDTTGVAERSKRSAEVSNKGDDHSSKLDLQNTIGAA